MKARAKLGLCAATQHANAGIASAGQASERERVAGGDDTYTAGRKGLAIIAASLMLKENAKLRKRYASDKPTGTHKGSNRQRIVSGSGARDYRRASKRQAAAG